MRAHIKQKVQGGLKGATISLTSVLIVEGNGGKLPVWVLGVVATRPDLLGHMGKGLGTCTQEGAWF